MRCDVCGQKFAPKGLAIHVGMKHTPHRPARLNRECLMRPFEGGNNLQVYSHRRLRWLSPAEAVDAIMDAYDG